MDPKILLPLLSGAKVTLELTFWGSLLTLLLSLLGGLGELSRRRLLRVPAAVYVEVFRGTSALVQLYWFYFALPLLGVNLDALTAGILVLGLNTGAYGSEVVRGALQAVPLGQHEAALALNLTRRQKLWRIILPQAVPAMIPPFGNLLIQLLKNTSLVSLITLSELTFAGQTLRAATLRTTAIFTWVLVIYFLMAQALAFLVNRLEKRLTRGLDYGGVR